MEKMNNKKAWEISNTKEVQIVSLVKEEAK